MASQFPSEQRRMRPPRGAEPQPQVPFNENGYSHWPEHETAVPQPPIPVNEREAWRNYRVDVAPQPWMPVNGRRFR